MGLMSHYEGKAMIKPWANLEHFTKGTTLQLFSNRISQLLGDLKVVFMDAPWVSDWDVSFILPNSTENIPTGF